MNYKYVIMQFYAHFQNVEAQINWIINDCLPEFYVLVGQADMRHKPSVN